MHEVNIQDLMRQSAILSVKSELFVQSKLCFHASFAFIYNQINSQYISILKTNAFLQNICITRLKFSERVPTTL